MQRKGLYDMQLEGGHFHLTGIAGCGMNALAQLLHARGASVWGSDRLCDQGEAAPLMEKLAGLGIEVFPQDGKAVKPQSNALVVSTAIEDDNPEIIAAREHGIPIVHRSRMLARCIEDMRTIAIGGTSGKTTTTGMLGWIFEQLSLDPTVINGASVLNWITPERIGNVRIGESEIAIIEADESDRSLLQFTPEFSSIGNISRDHFELDETIELFRLFAARTIRRVVCGPEVPIEQLASPKAIRVAFEQERSGGFSYKGENFELKMAGVHNLENALIAVALCDICGLDLHRVGNALRDFQGIERRLQMVGTAKGVNVIDDYAHNPAKIAAAWATVAEKSDRIIGIWRPHGFTPLHSMKDQLAETFRELFRPQDSIFILPVYYAGGTATRKTTARQFVDQLREAGVQGQFAQNYDELMEKLLCIAKPGDAILCMGARDPQLPRFAGRIVRELRTRTQ